MADALGRASTPQRIAAIGITNQRETTLLWERRDGRPDRQRDRLAGPAHGSAVRDAEGGRARARRCASGPASCSIRTSRRRRSRWLLDNVSGLRARAARGRARVRHRRQLPDLAADRRARCTRPTSPTRRARCCSTCAARRFADELCDAVRGAAGRCCRRSARRPGASARRAASRGCPTGSRSRASPAISRRRCSARPASTPGDAKCTYGTGAFLLMNIGAEPELSSRHGLLTTVAWRWPTGETGRPRTRSRAARSSPGALVQWLRDGLGIIRRPPRSRRSRAGPRRGRRDHRAGARPASARRTGDPRRAASSPASPAAPPGRTSRAPRWRRSRSRTSTSCARCRRTPAAP